MSKQIFENLLNSFKKSNNVRKLVLANKAGYATIDAYRKYLEEQVNGKFEKAKKATKTTKKVAVTIHVVDVIDCSGSMSGSKIRNANKGINDGIKKLKENKEDVNYTYTVCDFSDSYDINFKHTKETLDKVTGVDFGSRGSTALYDAIGKTIEKMKKNLGKDDKVLINVYTDGQENVSRTYTSSTLSKLIKEIKGTMTVTFIGTKQDVDYVVRNLGIEESNTLSYDGTGAGLEKTMAATRGARETFSMKASKGEDVSLGFYKNVTSKKL